MAAVEAGQVPATSAPEDAARDAPEAVGAGPEAPLLPAGNRLSLHLYPGGCRRLLRLCAQQAPQLLEVDFLQLSGHEDPQLLEATLARLPWSLPHLRSLVLKGGQRRDALGACLRGSLTTLPTSLSGLAHLAHLDLSFNSLETLPACVPQMCGLDALLLSRNCLSELPAALGALPSLTFLAVTHNRLRTLPPALGALSSLQRLDLSGNLLEALPAEIGGLGSLAELNLASNRLQSLPGSFAGLRALRLCILHSNLLASVPASLARLPLLTRLDLRDNQLRDVPPELLDAPFVRLQGNPLGRPPPDPPSPPGTPMLPEMPRLLLTSDLDSFAVTPQGCSVTLACGVRLQFPAGATAAPVTVHYRQWLPEPRLVPLGPHDTLLSGVLELQPHGVAFQQEVGLWLLFVPPRARRCREVVVRTLSDSSWSDLETHLEEEVPQAGAARAVWEGPALLRPAGPDRVLPHQRLWAHCQVPHFSWFLVVARPVSDACLVPPEGALLCSSGHAGVRVTFPAGATEEPRHVRMQVTRFSWYWLWYTTKTCVGGLARKAWERLRLHRVNLIALQRRRDPEQVLLQCLPRNKVDATLRRLLERYRGPEPSDTVEMFEGEKFFAAFERGIDIDADRPDCVEGRVCFVFYSHLKNLKEVYVTTALDRRARAVRGQVSFYRGEVPEVVPEEAEAARQKRGTAALWMATLPIKLPRLRGCEGPARGAGLSLAPLNLGDAETGFLTQSNLLNVARRLGPDWPAVALHLGLPYRELQRIRHEFRDDLDGQIRHMLFSWAERQAGQPGAVGRLVQALEQSDRRDVAEEVRAVLELGRHKYQEGLRHTSLAPRNLASPDQSPSPSPEPAQT
ncbi:p53-induced death domain-containing protein 1 isoform X3 [Odocoileus virginianus]|uniref:P53-induced death domain-containing protein 1 isoform X3 n=1 Tax=Odocoileus virginianus TaxID=9874 RepID=A0ABM4HEM9_ODOVR